MPENHRTAPGVTDRGWPTTANRWLAAGVSGAAVAGFGLLLAAQSDAPTTTARAVELASFDSLLNTESACFRGTLVAVNG